MQSCTRILVLLNKYLFCEFCLDITQWKLLIAQILKRQKPMQLQVYHFFHHSLKHSYYAQLS